MNYLLYGVDTGRIQKEINKIVQEFSQDYDLIQYDLKTSSMNEVLFEIGTIPFFSAHKVVVVKNCDFLSSASIDFDLNQFENYLKNPILENVLIMTGEFEKCDTRIKIVKLVNQTCRVKSFQSLDDKDKKSYIVEKLRQLQADISSDALNELISRLPIDTNVIDHQLEKIACYPDKITVEVVEALILKPIEENVFLLSESILNKKFHKAYSIYKDMISLSYDPIYLIAVISSQFRFYYQVKTCMKQMMSEDSITSYLKAHPYRVKLTCQIVRNIRIDRIMRILDACLQCDVDIKTGVRDKYLAFELFLIHCREE